MYFIPRIYMKWLKRIFMPYLCFMEEHPALFNTVCGLAVNFHFHWIQANYGLCEELLLTVLKISFLFMESFLIHVRQKRKFPRFCPTIFLSISFIIR